MHGKQTYGVAQYTNTVGPFVCCAWLKNVSLATSCPTYMTERYPSSLDRSYGCYSR